MKKALVVDNNEVILKILSHILQTRGLEVRSAKDGLSALEILKHYNPDIIFTDLVMPNIDGENLCRIISSRKSIPTPLLIVVSAAAIEDNLDFLAFGAHACIAKGPATEMAESIDNILIHLENGRPDLLKGKRFGVDDLAHRIITKELLEVKQHFKLIFDNIDNGLIEFSNTGHIVNCNSYATQLFGRNIVEMLSLDIRNIFPDVARHQVSDCLNRFLDKRCPVESSHPVEVNKKHIVFKILGMSDETSCNSIMILRDITEERLARMKLKNHLEQLEKTVAARTRSYEEANRELQKQIVERKKVNEELEFVAKQWSNTFDTISDFVSVHDKNMKLVRVNKALADFLGEKPENLIGRYCYEVMHGRNLPYPNCPHIAAIERGQTVVTEIDDKHVGLPLLVSCSPLMNDDGSLLGSVHIARDISEQKKATEIRENLIQQLERSLAKVRLLSGFIPICSSCKKIRDDQGYWQQVEEYIRKHSEAEFSHSICPTCAEKLYPELQNRKIQNVDATKHLPKK